MTAEAGWTRPMGTTWSAPNWRQSVSVICRHEPYNQIICVCWICCISQFNSLMTFMFKFSSKAKRKKDANHISKRKNLKFMEFLETLPLPLQNKDRLYYGGFHNDQYTSLSPLHSVGEKNEKWNKFIFKCHFYIT